MEFLDYLEENNIDYKDEDGKIVVKEGLDLDYTQITKLPEKLSVDGDLCLKDTPITELPEGLSVGGDLYLSYSKITKLPEGLSVGGRLDLIETPITELPNKLSVGGNLYLKNTQITKLPEGLTVKGRLYLDAEKITNIAYRENCGIHIRTIFAAYVNGAIQIVAGWFLGNIEAFEAHIDEEYSGTEALKYKQAARECIKELEEMRSR